MSLVNHKWMNIHIVEKYFPKIKQSKTVRMAKAERNVERRMK